MHVSAHRAFGLLRELGYERVSGSAQERAVAQRLLEEVQGAGVAAHLEEFSVPCGREARPAEGHRTLRKGV